MFDLEKAKKNANAHTKDLLRPADGHRIVVEDPVAVDAGRYFDYKIIGELDIREDEQEQFAGAFGILVDKVSGRVSEMSHHQWVDLVQ